MGLLFKLGQAVPEIFTFEYPKKGGFCWQELKGNFILGVAPKQNFWWFFCSPLGINPNNFVKNYPFFKTKGLFYGKSLSSFTGNIFHVSKKEPLGSGASKLVLD